eukprot:16450553-Heterocapsa_arctica.AAC.1
MSHVVPFTGPKLGDNHMGTAEQFSITAQQRTMRCAATCIETTIYNTGATASAVVSIVLISARAFQTSILQPIVMWIFLGPMSTIRSEGLTRKRPD